MDDEEIQALVSRLSRPHPSGGEVIERAAILAAGCDVTAVLAWILEHDGRPEATPVPVHGSGLHGARMHDAGASKPPARFVLPTGALT